MAIDISAELTAIAAAKTADADYNGKKICELPDMVANSAAELKKRFDAAVIDVLDPKYRECVESVIAALGELVTQMNKALDAKPALSHSHRAEDITTGVIPLERGGTCASTANGARNVLDVYSTSETKAQISNLISQHDENSAAHANRFDAVTERIAALETTLDGLEEVLAAI